MKKMIKKLLWNSGYFIGNRFQYEQLIEESRLEMKAGRDLLNILLSREGVDLGASKSQLGQDIVALLINNFKRQGYFVEFGATNGFDLSNTYLLESRFGWDGILAEPLPRWRDELKKNRTCKIDNHCVWSISGERLDFLDVDMGELSTIATFAESDGHKVARENSRKIYVNTISLTDLLKKYDAPRVIDYMSIDTEGSELEILSRFDFSQYDFKFISIEHNYTKNREKITRLMDKNGFTPILRGLSKWDDWFVPIK